MVLAAPGTICVKHAEQTVAVAALIVYAEPPIAVTIKLFRSIMLLVELA